MGLLAPSLQAHVNTCFIYAGKLLEVTKILMLEFIYENNVLPENW